MGVAGDPDDVWVTFTRDLPAILAGKAAD